MSNEIARQYSAEAMGDFHLIDQGQKGYLNLLDIKNYEKKGPEQAKVGKFLEDNYDAVRGNVANADPYDYASIKASSYITMSNLNELNEYADPLRAKELNNKRIWDGIRSTVGPELFSSVAAAVPGGLAAGLVSDVVPGAGLPVFLAVEAATLYGVYELSQYGINKDHAERQAEVDKMK